MKDELKIYQIWTLYGVVEFRAERIERQSVNDKPTKIVFFVDEEIIAEFFTAKICGWVERKNDGE